MGCVALQTLNLQPECLNAPHPHPPKASPHPIVATHSGMPPCPHTCAPPCRAESLDSRCAQQAKELGAASKGARQLEAQVWRPTPINALFARARADGGPGNAGGNAGVGAYTRSYHLGGQAAGGARGPGSWRRRFGGAHTHIPF
eukprot:364498-Chlamydomonas_euryale.AAC.1